MSTGRPGPPVAGLLAFSAVGTTVAFPRWNVGGTQRTDIYVYDRGTRQATLATPAAGASTGSNGTKTWVRGFDPTNANRLLFTSNATNLVTNVANGATEDVYVRYLGAGATRLVTVTAAANQSGPGWSSRAFWVGDGTRIAFVSQSHSFGPTDTNSWPDVYVRDETAQTYRLVSLNAAGTNSGQTRSGQQDTGFGITIEELSVSADGARVAFGSDAPDLGPPDTGTLDGHDVFVAELVKPPSS
jgi:Tol biopolymer transport system component